METRRIDSRHVGALVLAAATLALEGPARADGSGAAGDTYIIGITGFSASSGSSEGEPSGVAQMGSHASKLLDVPPQNVRIFSHTDVKGATEHAKSLPPEARIVVVGHSLGGPAAIAVIVGADRRVDHLFTIDPVTLLPGEVLHTPPNAVLHDNYYQARDWPFGGSVEGATNHDLTFDYPGVTHTSMDDPYLDCADFCATNPIYDDLLLGIEDAGGRDWLGDTDFRNEGSLLGAYHGGFESNGTLAEALLLRRMQRGGGAMFGPPPILPAPRRAPPDPDLSVLDVSLPGARCYDATPDDVMALGGATAVRGIDCRGDDGAVRASLLAIATEGKPYPHRHGICERAGGGELRYLTLGTLRGARFYTARIREQRGARGGALSDVVLVDAIRMPGGAIRFLSAWHGSELPEIPGATYVSIRAVGSRLALARRLASQALSALSTGRIATIEGAGRRPAPRTFMRSARFEQKTGTATLVLTRIGPAVKVSVEAWLSPPSPSARTTIEARANGETQVSLRVGAAMHGMFEIDDGTGAARDAVFLAGSGAWAAFVDRGQGRLSTARLTTVLPDAPPLPTPEVLPLPGDVTLEGKIDAYAGVLRSIGRGEGEDLSGLGAVRFTVSGTTGDWRLCAMDAGDLPESNAHCARLDVTALPTTHVIALADLARRGGEARPLRVDQLANLSFVLDPPDGPPGGARPPYTLHVSGVALIMAPATAEVSGCAMAPGTRRAGAAAVAVLVLVPLVLLGARRRRGRSA